MAAGMRFSGHDHCREFQMRGNVWILHGDRLKKAVVEERGPLEEVRPYRKASPAVRIFSCLFLTSLSSFRQDNLGGIPI